jgi:hypothetical protein
MSINKKPAAPARVTGLHKIDAAAKQPRFARQPTAHAHVLVTWRRPRTVGIVVRCFACGRLHLHAAALGTAEPVLRASRCGLAAYLLDVDAALSVTA